MSASRGRQRAAFPVANEELRTVREGMRNLGGIVDDLQGGKGTKIVFVRQGQMQGVLVSVDEYADLLAARRDKAAA